MQPMDNCETDWQTEKCQTGWQSLETGGDVWRFSLPQSCKFQGETDTRLGGTSRPVRKRRGYNERCMACGFEEASMERIRGFYFEIDLYKGF